VEGSAEGSRPASREDREQRALASACRYLNRRERTVSEVRSHLEGQDFDQRTVDAAIAELLELGTLDDARFARVFAQDKRELEQWGAERIRRGLHARGVERDLIDAFVLGAELESEFERALAVLRRRFPDPPGDRRERGRALGILLRKGYDTETALEALRSYARAWVDA
jgi:regulatory protein